MNFFKMNYNFSQPINYTKKNEPPVFDKTRFFYICSFGGSGSTVLFNYLSQYGTVEHIHDRFPPEKLTYVGKKNTTDDIYSEWFNKTEIPSEDVKNYTVIFIYRNPLDVILSRYVLPNGEPHTEHLKHVMCKNDGNIRLSEVLHSGKDMYGIEEFFNNYTTGSKERNYKIICVKYELFWDNIAFFNNVIKIPDIKRNYPARYERKKKLLHFNKQLSSIYCSLINKMKNKLFIEIN